MLVLLTALYDIITLTSLHLFVPGELGDIEKVIVDVGTGYMVEKVKDCVI
jgi:prefoldin subunit 5